MKRNRAYAHLATYDGPPNPLASPIRPFGEYLQPGVHRVTMSTYGSSGAEVWLLG